MAGQESEPTTLLRPDRRDFLKVLGLGTTATVAGCSGLSGGDGGSESPTGDGTEQTTDTDTGDGDGNALPRDPSGTNVGVVGSDASSLNWLYTNTTTAGSYVGLTLDGAWAIDPDQNVFPLWAEPSTDDGRVYEIELRDNLQWGAGYGQMTAEDWIYTIENVFKGGDSPQDNWAGYTNAGQWFVGPDNEPIEVEKVDKLTFEVRLPEVDPSFPLKPILWGQNCLPRGLLEQYVPDEDTEGLKNDEELRTLAYTGNLGPYTYEEWDRQSQFVTTRNDEYYLREVDDLDETWSRVPYFERSVIQVIPEQSSRLNALKQGEITSAGIPPRKAQEFKQNQDIDVYVQPQPFALILAYNMRANGWEPFREIPVRQAFACAIDKNALAENLYRGYAQPAYTMQPRFSKWYSEEAVDGLRFGTGDLYGPEPARKRMERGIEDRPYEYDGDTLVGPDGDPVTLSLYASSASQTNQTLAELIAQNLQNNLGITAEVKTVTGRTFQLKYAANSPPEGESYPWGSRFNGGPRDVSVGQNPWDMSVNIGLNTYPLTPSSSATFFKKRGDTNYYGYVPESNIPELYSQASSTLDEEKRAELFAEVFRKIAREQPLGFLIMESDITGAQDELVGPTNDFFSGWDSQRYYFADE